MIRSGIFLNLKQKANEKHMSGHQQIFSKKFSAVKNHYKHQSHQNNTY